MLSPGKAKDWTCAQSSGATNQDLQNAVDDVGIVFTPNTLTVEPKHCYVSICGKYYFSLCNYGHKNSTEPVGQRMRAREWGLPGGNGTDCRGNFGEKVNYDWYEFWLADELEEIWMDLEKLSEMMLASLINAHEVATHWPDDDCHRIANHFNDGIYGIDAVITTFAALKIPGPQFRGGCNQGIMLELPDDFEEYDMARHAVIPRNETEGV
ncbi:hypothetical protein FANTH_14049 [Fusarium anthophilum]|uniref:Uncharacterized protein n=1 Tax=Fusarium anthophilum TaxID=48485 RepID=A0A8H4YKK5_9HYPO|nr:hypothetical protein FANTH_14049 [Fusarium anthophilum]